MRERSGRVRVPGYQGDALIEFLDWFGLGLRVVLAMLTNVAAPR